MTYETKRKEMGVQIMAIGIRARQKNLNIEAEVKFEVKVGHEVREKGD